MTNHEMEELISDVSFVAHDLTRKAFAKIDVYLKNLGLYEHKRRYCGCSK